uniref:YcbK family protein n=1 Tax=Marivivens sp. TaxID=1978374 RepID=UPI0025C06C76
GLGHCPADFCTAAEAGGILAKARQGAAASPEDQGRFTSFLLDVSEPYMLLSGYRSPETNAMLRRQSSGVARNSLHMRGQAADLRLASRSVNQIASAAQSCNAGGVGRYAGSNFVHMDCGQVRTWNG